VVLGGRTSRRRVWLWHREEEDEDEGFEIRMRMAVMWSSGSGGPAALHVDVAVKGLGTEESGARCACFTGFESWSFKAKPTRDASESSTDVSSSRRDAMGRQV